MVIIEQIDHIVLTVASVQRACNFYSDKLDMDVITLGKNRKILKLGSFKIKLRQLGSELKPKARNTHPGCVNICFITRTPVEKIRKKLIKKKVLFISEITKRIGIDGPMKSIYFHDPDGNLLEISNYLK